MLSSLLLLLGFTASRFSDEYISLVNVSVNSAEMCTERKGTAVVFEVMEPNVQVTELTPGGQLFKSSTENSTRVIMFMQSDAYFLSKCFARLVCRRSCSDVEIEKLMFITEHDEFEMVVRDEL